MLDLTIGENHDSYSNSENAALLLSFLDNQYAKKACLNDFKSLGYKEINQPFYVFINLKLYNAQELKSNSGRGIVMLREKNGNFLLMDREKFMPVIFQHRNVKDPVIALWNEFKRVTNAYNLIEDYSYEYLRKMSAEERKVYYKSNSKLDSRYCTIEAQEIAKVLTIIEDKFLSTPATTKEGLSLQIKYKAESIIKSQAQNEISKFLKICEEGLVNL